MISVRTMWLFSVTLALVAAHDGSTMVTFLGQECDDAVTPKVYAKGGQPGDKVKDLAECVELCEASDDCQSVTYYHRESWTDANKITHKEQKWCKHFYTACGSLKKSGGATTVTHLTKMDSYWSLAPIGFGRQCQGTPLSSSGTQDSLKKCMSTCDVEPDCKSVTFSDKTCSHYSTVCENSPNLRQHRKEDMVSMVRRTDQRGALQSQCDMGKGANGLPREKWLKSLAVADLAACEKSCKHEAKCQSITFTFRKDWKHNCNQFETKCLYRQPQSMAIAKTLKLDMPTSGKNSVYLVDKQKSDFCDSANAVCDCSYRCKPGFTFTADQNKVGKCSANKCSCPNGSAKTGAACTKDGAAMCSSCKDGYSINTDQTKCSANKCNCPNGSAKTGAACTKDGAAMCSSCKDGYTINKDQTKCSDKRARFCSSPNAVCTYSCKPGYTLNKDQTKCSGPPKVVVAGWQLTMVVKQDDTLWVTGWNDHGQLGDGTTTSWPGQATSRNTFKQVMAGVKTVAAGNYHTMAVKHDGTLWAAGQGKYGQLGDGTAGGNTFKQIMTGVKSVAAGSHYTMVVKQDDTLWGTGWNNDGQLGDGTTTKRTTFKQVLIGVKAVAAGSYHTMVVKHDGTLWAAGENRYGQLGDGTRTHRKRFKQVLTGVKAVAAGKKHTMVVKLDGTLWVAGWDEEGQLGDGTANNHGRAFHQVLAGVKSVAAGQNHAMVVKQDGTLWATGWNRFGQLGDGTTTDRNAFKQVLAGVKAVAAGKLHTMVVKLDGSLWVTGGNEKGQLGVGSTFPYTKTFKQITIG